MCHRRRMRRCRPSRLGCSLDSKTGELVPSDRGVDGLAGQLRRRDRQHPVRSLHRAPPFTVPLVGKVRPRG